MLAGKASLKSNFHLSPANIRFMPGAHVNETVGGCKLVGQNFMLVKSIEN